MATELRPTRAGRRLRAWREAQGLTQSQAAERATEEGVSVSQASWSDYETGRKTPGLRLALGLQDVTGGDVTAPLWLEEDSDAA